MRTITQSHHGAHLFGRTLEFQGQLGNLVVLVHHLLIMDLELVGELLGLKAVLQFLQPDHQLGLFLLLEKLERIRRLGIQERRHRGDFSRDSSGRSDRAAGGKGNVIGKAVRLRKRAGKIHRRFRHVVLVGLEASRNGPVFGFQQWPFGT